MSHATTLPGMTQAETDAYVAMDKARLEAVIARRAAREAARDAADAATQAAIADAYKLMETADAEWAAHRAAEQAKGDRTMEAGTAVTTRTGLEAVTLARPFTDAFGTECVKVRSVKNGTPYGSARVVKLDGLTVKAVATDVETAPATDSDAYTASQEAIPFRAWAELDATEQETITEQVAPFLPETDSGVVYERTEAGWLATRLTPARQPVARSTVKAVHPHAISWHDTRTDDPSERYVILEDADGEVIGHGPTRLEAWEDAAHNVAPAVNHSA